MVIQQYQLGVALWCSSKANSPCHLRLFTYWTFTQNVSWVFDSQDDVTSVWTMPFEDQRHIYKWQGYSQKCQHVMPCDTFVRACVGSQQVPLEPESYMFAPSRQSKKTFYCSWVIKLLFLQNSDPSIFPHTIKCTRCMCFNPESVTKTLASTHRISLFRSLNLH